MPRISPKTSSITMGSQPMMPAAPMHSPSMAMANNMANNMMTNGNNMKTTSMSSPVTYIPALCDGACGTTPRSQMPVMAMLRHEMAQMLQTMPSLCWAMLTQPRQMSWADMGDMMMHTLLACMEMAMMAAALPLCMILPGAMFMTWMTVCAGVVMAMCWMLNGREQMHHCSAGAGAGAEGWMMDTDAQQHADEKWMFIGGMGMRYLPFLPPPPQHTNPPLAPDTRTRTPSPSSPASSPAP